MTDTITSRCEAIGLRMTGQRRIIAAVLLANSAKMGWSRSASLCAAAV